LKIIKPIDGSTHNSPQAIGFGRYLPAVAAPNGYGAASPENGQKQS
jgi:hypothetical protein